MSFYQQMGFMAHPMTIVGILMLVQVGRCVFDIARDGEGNGAALRIHSVLILGVLGACLGLLGTFVGLYLAGAFIEQANEVSFRLIAGGFKVALGTSIYGFLMLGFASIAWLTLQFAKGRRDAHA